MTGRGHHRRTHLASGMQTPSLNLECWDDPKVRVSYEEIGDKPLLEVTTDGICLSLFHTCGRNVPSGYWISFDRKITVRDKLKTKEEINPELREKWTSWVECPRLQTGDHEKFATMREHNVFRTYFGRARTWGCSGGVAKPTS